MASSARFDELKKKFDENPRRYFAPLANEFRKTGDAEQAVMICEEFLPQQPGHMSGHIVYGQALFDLGRLDEARTVFETALTLDPENLIALRHLGDIARAHEDLESARHWYQRVLDVDPRSEEVQALIGGLDTEGPASPASAPSSPVAPQSSEASLGETAHAVPTVDLALPPLELASTVEFVPPPPLPQGAPPPMESLLELDVVEEQVISAPPSAAAEPPFDSISLEGLEPTSSTPTEPESHVRAEGLEPMEFSAPHGAPAVADGIADRLESGEFSAPAAPIAPLPGLEETALGAFEAPAAAAPPPLPDLEPMPETAYEASEQPPVDIPPEVIAAEAELIDAREELARIPAGAMARAEPMHPSERAAQGEPVPASEPPSSAPHGGEPAPRVTPSQPFVTETMAELYVKQGFREQALDVYTLLLAATPDSQRLRDRIAELQPPAAEDSGPNVREFFARLAAHRPGDRGAAAEPPASDDFASFDSFETLPEPNSSGAGELATQSEAVAPAPFGEASAPATSPAPDGGSIDALFGQRPVGSADATAASALAQAFGGADSEAPAITGRPARAAAGELSLDSVFRDGGARPPRSAQSFSFDQFFSESASAARPPEQAPTPTPSQGTGAQSETGERNADDIEQFNSWLQGLKQR